MRMDQDLLKDKDSNDSDNVTEALDNHGDNSICLLV